MKKYFLLLITLFILSGCDEDESVDTSIMPEITADGCQTFGCLIDGWLYVGGRYINWESSFMKPNFEFYYYTNNTEEDYVEATIRISDYQYIYFTILQPREGETCTYTNFHFDGTDFPDGQVKIICFDKGRQVISGTFEDGNRVTHGRFDMVYRE